VSALRARAPGSRSMLSVAGDDLRSGASVRTVGGGCRKNTGHSLIAR
jgi:hypothetical protein